MLAGALALIITQAFSGIPGQLVDPNALKDLLRSGPALTAQATIPDRDMTGLSMVVPGDYQPPPKYLTTPMGATDPQFAYTLYKAGGVRVPPIGIQIIITGHRNQEIRVVDIVPEVVKRSEPLTGTIFLLGGQGLSETRSMGIDFDAARPVARERAKDDRPTPGPLSEPYFNNHTITLKDNEQEVVYIPLHVTKYYVEFDLRIEYLVGNKKRELVLSNESRHFKVTAFRPGPTDDSLPYLRAYGLRVDFSICPLDPMNIKDRRNC